MTYTIVAFHLVDDTRLQIITPRTGTTIDDGRKRGSGDL
jgi:hypothetical protein